MARASPDEVRQVIAGSCLLLHELAESLTAIENYAAGARYWLKENATDSSELANALTCVADQVRRAADVMRRLRILLDSGGTGRSP
ncbi:MAG TPA: hypothetical protein VG848_13885 [Acetobacteraceae bacterium]|nr:hypothetical protein [Acetobacteraceae bacterium]